MKRLWQVGFSPRKHAGGRGLLAWLLLVMGLVALGSTARAQAQATAPPPTLADDQAAEDNTRQGYIVDVELPLIGQRDEVVRQQIVRIADTPSEGKQRPVVVLRFQAKPLAELADAVQPAGLGSRGSQFERCLALARFLTSAEAARVRLIAYLPETVEGHAVLPVLACEEIVAAVDAELGRAAIDEPLDATVQGAYRDVVSRRATLPEAVVMAMLDAQAEVFQLELAEGGTRITDRATAEKLREAGEVLREETIWPGGGLALFSGQQLRSRRWIARTVKDASELPSALGLSGTLRTSGQLPRQWQPVKLTLSGQLNAARVNQTIRALTHEIDQGTNLLVVQLGQTDTNFTQAARLASFLAGLDQQRVYTLGLITEPVSGPACLIAVACQETVLLSEASLGPDPAQQVVASGRDTQRRVLDDLAVASSRPLPLLSALADPAVQVNEYIHQDSGKRAIFADWQIAEQADAQLWLAKQRVAGGGVLDNDVALRYRLVDSQAESISLAFSRIGLQQPPPELSSPWLDASIQMLLSQSWLPRLLLMIGFFALMVELGNPGISAGGLLAGLCFLGFFWIEGLNGNVEWLEILLFVAGLVALAIELFVVPGFGLFGIGGLLMLLVSIVLASQTFVWPTTSAQLNEVAWNLLWVAVLALGGMIGLLFMHKQLERSPVLRWVTLQPTGAEDAAALNVREATVHREHLLGQDGLTTTRLNPSGKAQFGRDIVAVVGTGKLIEEGVPVRVVEVRGNLVLVEEL
ncbi:MAG: hypothetical protein KDA45_01990 [Planctomycetales bacterium]|nr:hypothetical protein [Planctomycetales bacterium]